MFEDDPILIVEDNVYLALDLSNAIEDCHGRVVGPVRTVDDALAVLSGEEVSGVVLDFHLDDEDASPIAAYLASEGVPFVIHSHTELPPEITDLHPGVPVLMKPVHPSSVLECLLSEILKSRSSESAADQGLFLYRYKDGSSPAPYCGSLVAERHFRSAPALGVHDAHRYRTYPRTDGAQV